MPGLVFVEEIFFRTGFRVVSFLETDNDAAFIFGLRLLALMVVNDLGSDPDSISANKDLFLTEVRCSLPNSIYLMEYNDGTKLSFCFTFLCFSG